MKTEISIILFYGKSPNGSEAWFYWIKEGYYPPPSPEMGVDVDTENFGHTFSCIDKKISFNLFDETYDWSISHDYDKKEDFWLMVDELAKMPNIFLCDGNSTEDVKNRLKNIVQFI